jgi:hypothetical protein
MKKPKLSEYGLKGIDSRPMLDVENAPVSDEERGQALEQLIEWQVGNNRAAEFRQALYEYEWANGGR